MKKITIDSKCDMILYIIQSKHPYTVIIIIYCLYYHQEKGEIA